MQELQSIALKLKMHIKQWGYGIKNFKTLFGKQTEHSYKTLGKLI